MARHLNEILYIHYSVIRTVCSQVRCLSWNDGYSLHLALRAPLPHTDNCQLRVEGNMSTDVEENTGRHDPSRLAASQVEHK